MAHVNWQSPASVWQQQLLQMVLACHNVARPIMQHRYSPRMTSTGAVNKLGTATCAPHIILNTLIKFCVLHAYYAFTKPGPLLSVQVCCA